MIPTTLQDRLKQFMEESNLSAAELAREASVSRASVSLWLSGATKALGADTTVRLARSFGLPKAFWLATGQHVDEDMLESLPSSRREEVEQIRIPQYDAAGGMGNGLELRDQPGLITSWSVTRPWLAQNVRGATSAENLCIVTGFGDSMRPMFNPGDPLLVDRGVITAEYDAVYFFRVGNEGFIKRLQRIPGRGLTAISENKVYEPWVVQDDMDFEVFGRVLKVWRSEDF